MGLPKQPIRLGPPASRLNHLRPHVLELVFELDLLGDGDPVLGNAGGSV